MASLGKWRDALAISRKRKIQSNQFSSNPFETIASQRLLSTIPYLRIGGGFGSR